jgi:hypothetical protein
MTILTRYLPVSSPPSITTTHPTAAPVPSAICQDVEHQFIADQKSPSLSLSASMSANRFDST